MADPHAGEMVVVGMDGSLSTRRLSWPTAAPGSSGVTSEESVGRSAGAGSASGVGADGDVDALSARRAKFIAGLLKFEERRSGRGARPRTP
ncbi:hypothetical protein, partial [Saccharopolyspora erythraea]